MSNALINDLKKLLLTGTVTTQEEICDALQQQGYQVNQSTISRLLRKIGAAKSKNEQGNIVYRLPLEPAPPTVGSELSSLIIDIVANETTLIVYTSPGSAQLIARILDYHKQRVKILATIAGDDTILIVPTSINSIKESLQLIKKLVALAD